MNERDLRPGTVTAAAALLGGVLVVLAPHHLASIVRLVAVTIAAAAVLYALAVHVPEWSVAGRWMSPFSRMARAGTDRPRSVEIDRIRSKLSSRRQRIDGAPALPPDILRLLKPLITVALERRGVDPEDEAGREAARRLLSPLTWTVLTTPVLQWPAWFRTARSNEREVAGVVHEVLDELDRLGAGRSGARAHTHSPQAWMT